MTNALKALISAVEVGEWDHSPNGIVQAVFPYKSASAGDFGRTAHEAFAGSLDAAKTLHDNLLPDWLVQYFGQDWKNQWWITLLRPVEGDEKGNVTRPSRTVSSFDNDLPARAWLLAILMAKLAGEE